MKISKLYKYPIKSLTPFESDSLDLNKFGYINGDRLFGFRFQNAGDRNNYEWQRKTNFAALMHMPQIAKLKVNFNEQTRILIVKNNEEIIIESHIDLNRSEIETNFTNFVLETDPSLIEKFPERFPFILIGGEDHAHFHDGKDGGVTLHSQESLNDLNKKIGYEIDHRRFRSNIIIEGIEPWEEFQWIGKQIVINNLNFRVEKPVTRCLAINCNPEDGTTDKNVLKAMLDFQDKKPPEFSVKLIPLNNAGKISVGDPVHIS